MLLTEYDEAKQMELFRRDGIEEGKEIGRKEGREEGLSFILVVRPVVLFRL